MSRFSIILVCMAMSGAVSAQFVLGRQSMSCFSIRACDELCINSTAGQIDFGTMTNSNTIFTSGFEQSEGSANLYLNIDFKKDECSGFIKASIIQTFGCESADTVYVFWDNTPSALNTQLSGSLHTLRLETNTGCVFEKVYDFQQLNVPVIPCGLVFYNYLSPNGDGENDSWNIGKITSPDFFENEVVILNRWGSEVWSGKNYDNSDVSWSGKGSNGLDLPDGTYFYRVRTLQGEYSGYVELMR